MTDNRRVLHLRPKQAPTPVTPQPRLMDVSSTLIDQPALTGAYDEATKHVILTIAFPAKSNEEGMAILQAAGLNRFLADVMRCWQGDKARREHMPGDVTGVWRISEDGEVTGAMLGEESGT